MLKKLRSKAFAAYSAFMDDVEQNRSSEEGNVYVTSKENFFNNGSFKKSGGIKKGFNYNTNVYSIINAIAEAGANLPIEIYKINSKGEEEILTFGAWYNFIMNPNPQNDYNSFMYQSMVNQLATGNTIERGVKAIGFPEFAERWNLSIPYVNIDTMERSEGYVPSMYKYKFGKKEYKYNPDEILHIKKYNPDEMDGVKCWGLSPLTACYRTLKASNEVFTAESEILGNRSASGILTSDSDTPLTTEEREMGEDAIKKRGGGAEKYGKLLLTSGKLRLIKLNHSSEDLQLLNSGVFKLRNLAATYNVSSKLFNDPNGATYNSSKEDEKKFFTKGVLPTVDRIHNSYKFYAKDFEEVEGGKVGVRVDRSKIEALQEDESKKSKRQKTSSEIMTKIISGISDGKWGKETAKEMLIESMEISEEKAIKLLSDAKENKE